MSTTWDEIVLDPVIVGLAELIRREWRVWLGVLERGGEVVPIGALQEPITRPLCACFKANPIVAPSSPDSATLSSCARTLREWSSGRAEGATGRPVHVRCHVGLSALLLPIRDAEQATVARLYASGYVPERSEAMDLIEIKRAFLKVGIPESEETRRWFEELPRCPLPSELALEKILGLLVSRIEARLQRIVPQEGRGVSSQLADTEGFYGMIGASPPMRQLFRLIERVAATNSTVLILGENGTGKELVARAIHRASRRQDRPYVVQNCAAIPADLIESELFGHKRGAFSGAHRDREGLFEAADQGTFFLDEIGEMDLVLQAKMLRVLQDGTFLPVGDSVYRKVDVRLICATNRELEAMVRAGGFREDLFFRINVITLTMPPLRARSSDIPLLASYFLARAAREHGTPLKRLSEACLQHLVSYEWPGNVRELENEIERLVILSGSQHVIEPADLSPRIARTTPQPLVTALSEMSLPDAVEHLERQMILESLQRNDFNKTQVAKELGISRRNLIRKVARYDFDAKDD